MLLEPTCWTRQCKYFQGVKVDNEDEETERNICKAFPDGIPYDIAYGNNLHSKLFPNQVGNFIFEKK